jgi:hypothetical protein
MFTALVVICKLLQAISITGFQNRSRKQIAQSEVSRGLGRHAWDLTYSQYNKFCRRMFCSQYPGYHRALLTLYSHSGQSIAFYQATLTFTKISIILQCLRIFVATRIRRTCWIIFAIVVGYGNWSAVSAIFMCRPVAYFWDKTIANGYCLPEQPVWFGNVAINIATDIAILTLPVPALSALKLPKKQKIGLMMVLALGGV